MKKKQPKKKKWIKKRHAFWRAVVYPFIWIYSRLKYGFTVEKFKDEEKRPYLILFNHQTAFDQFFVGFGFKSPIYYVASEDLFSKGFVSALLKYAVAPIPIRKQATDIGAIMNIARVAKEGGAIALSPEGNRTFSGKTGYMAPAIAALTKRLKLPLVLYRIEGGYGVQPRWSDVIRKGKMRAYVAKVVYPEQYAAMSEDELMAEIERVLYVDEGADTGNYYHKKRAEYVERAMYVCPKCGLTTFESHNEKITCKGCGLEITYGVDKRLTSPDEAFKFEFTTDWYDYQCDYINSLNTLENTEKPYYVERASFVKVTPSVRQDLIEKNCEVCLYGDRLTVKGKTVDMTFDFENTFAITVLGKNKVNIYYGNDLYQLQPSKRFNGLKYVNFFHRYKNIKKGADDGKFLGL